MIYNRLCLVNIRLGPIFPAQYHLSGKKKGPKSSWTQKNLIENVNLPQRLKIEGVMTEIREKIVRGKREGPNKQGDKETK